MNNYSEHAHKKTISICKKTSLKIDARSQFAQSHAYLLHKRVVSFLKNITTGYDFTYEKHPDTGNDDLCLNVRLHQIENSRVVPAYRVGTNKTTNEKFFYKDKGGRLSQQATRLFSTYKDEKGVKLNKAKIPKVGATPKKCFFLVGATAEELKTYRGDVYIMGGIVDALILHEATQAPVIGAPMENVVAFISQIARYYIAPYASLISSADHDSAGIGFLQSTEDTYDHFIIDNDVTIPTNFGCDWHDVFSMHGLDEVRKQAIENRKKLPYRRFFKADNDALACDISEKQSILDYESKLKKRFQRWPFFIANDAAVSIIDIDMHKDDHKIIVSKLSFFIQKHSKNALSFIRPSTYNLPIQKFERKYVRDYHLRDMKKTNELVEVLELTEGSIFNYDNNQRLIFDISDMGEGKTSLSILSICADILSKDSNAKILIIVNTKSLAASMVSNLKKYGIQCVAHYNDKFISNEDRILVSTLSSIEKNPSFNKNTDYLILDEIRQINQAGCDIDVGKKGQCLSYLHDLLKRMRYVFAADALATDFYIDDLLEKTQATKMQLIKRNRCMTHKKAKVFFYENEKKWIKQAHHFLKKNKAIYVANETKAGAEKDFSDLCEHFPNKRGLLLTADTDENNEHILFFKNVSKEALKYDFIVTTSVIASGNSIEPILNKMGIYVQHIYAVFFNTRGKFKGVSASLQMLARVRGSKEIHISTTRFINKKFNRKEKEKQLKHAANIEKSKDVFSLVSDIKMQILEEEYKETKNIGIELCLAMKYLGYEIANQHEYLEHDEEDISLKSENLTKEQYTNYLQSFSYNDISHEDYINARNATIKTFREKAIVDLYLLKEFLKTDLNDELISEHVHHNLKSQLFNIASMARWYVYNDDTDHIVFKKFTEARYKLFLKSMRLINNKAKGMGGSVCFQDEFIDGFSRISITEKQLLKAFDEVTNLKNIDDYKSVQLLKSDFDITEINKTKDTDKRNEKKLNVIKGLYKKFGLDIKKKRIKLIQKNNTKIKSNALQKYEFKATRLKKHTDIAKNIFCRKV